MTAALPSPVDVAVVGAGTAGAAAALFCARSGMRVLCLDRAPLDSAGARWVNGVSRSLFRAVGLDEPVAPELRGGGQPFHLIAGFDGPKLTISDHDKLEVDMRHLVLRLQTQAEAVGAVFAGGVRVHGRSSNVLHTTAGDVSAEVVVDASGLGGARLLEQPRVSRDHLCSAAQQVRACDPDGARRYFEARGAAEDESLCFTSVAGGFSVINLSYSGDEVSLLTGTIATQGRPGGQALLDRFVAGQPWIGDVKFGGARAIPLRRPFERIAAGRVAAIGDAAAQVFPAHGSGIAPGLLAAHCLADQLAGGAGPEGYAVHYQRNQAGLLAAYDLFRRFSQTLSSQDLGRMIESGVMNPATSRAGLEQRLPEPPSALELTRYAAALSRTPRLAARLASVVARMLAVRTLYSRYPESPARRAIWSRAIGRLFAAAGDAGSDLPHEARM